ncbi:MAG: M20/M25/M40 family metallo-hydrolase [Nitrospirota bacterium]|nr:M20/M25/M40 family metallo-hydrolase [Nitrospirota bacterium]
MKYGNTLKALAHFDQYQQSFLDDVISLIKVPSVSFAGFDRAQVQAAAQLVEKQCRDAGLANVRLLKEGKGYPAVYGEWTLAKGKPTVLLYAHYDVQPPGREALWKSPPFEPEVRKERLYGRGSADDKAGVGAHLAAIASYLHSSGSLPVNVKVLFEGEEEVGSTSLPRLIERNRNLLAADVLVIADTVNLDTGIPSLTVALRGLVTVKVEVRALAHSVHSGLWGGPLPDPALALSKMLAGLVDKQGRPAVKGLMKRVRRTTKRELAEIEALPFHEGLFREQSGIIAPAAITGGSAPAYAKMWYLPSIAVNAIEVSSRSQAANIISDVAWARLGIRTVADMDPDETLELLKAHLRKHAPWGVEVAIEPEPSATWWRTDENTPAFRAAMRALEKGYKRPAVKVGSGGSIPLVALLTEALGGIPALLVGVEDPYSNPHSENESLHIEDWKKACRSLIHLFDELAGNP